MAIRKISDLPYMTPEQMDVHDLDMISKLYQSSMELSYLSAASETAGRTYVSRQVQFLDMVHMLSGAILGGGDGTVLEFSKFVKFNQWLLASYVDANELYVRNGAHVSGDVYVNSTPSGVNGRSYVGKLAFGGGLDVYATTRIHPGGQVDSTTSDQKSIVNVGYLSQRLTALQSLLQGQIDALAERVRAIELVVASSGEEIGPKSIWPVGSVYLTTTVTSTCPIQNLAAGWVWTRVDAGAYLFIAGQLNGTAEQYYPGATINPGLPALDAESGWDGSDFVFKSTGGGKDDGGPHLAQGDSYKYYHNTITGLYFHYSKAPYGQSGTVRPKGYPVVMWLRTS